VDADLKTAKTSVTDLQKQVTDLTKEIADLRAQYEYVGLSRGDIARKIIANYAKSHVYEVDIYDCNDMSADVWNMLKAQGIGSVIVVGNIDTNINDILVSNHAWVLAEINPGEYLALETTTGIVVPKATNARYYQGWYFRTPADFNEYSMKVEMHNLLIAEDDNVVDEYNASNDPAAQGKLAAIHDRFQGLITGLEQQLHAVPTLSK
jgi:hypothetical protein